MPRSLKLKRPFYQGGWLFFVAENVIISENREQLVEYLGESNYRTLYSSLSTIAVASIGIGYFRFGRGQGPMLWKPTGFVPQTAAFVTQAAGLVGFSQLIPPLQLPFSVNDATTTAPGHAHPSIGADAAKSAQSAVAPLGLKARCPIDFDHSRKLEGRGDVSGMQRITRHPVLWSMGLVGLGFALGSPLATEVIFGVCPAIMTLIGGAHLDMRHRKSGVLTPAMDAKTSHVPFAAVALGVQRLADVAEELAWPNAAVAVALAAGLALRRRSALMLLR
jgi:prenyl protein peptidase